jgi:hypothetical protein
VILHHNDVVRDIVTLDLSHDGLFACLGHGGQRLSVCKAPRTGDWGADYSCAVDGAMINCSGNDRQI